MTIEEGVIFIQKKVFQSYQSKQINPDRVNQIQKAMDQQEFQSYQSKQINPDESKTLMGN